MLLGLTSLVGGVLMLVGSLAVRGTYISGRYYEEPNVGLVLAAGIAIGAIVSVPARATGRPLLAARVRIAGGMAAVTLAILLSLPGPLTPDLQRRFGALHRAGADVEAVMPQLRQIMTSVRGPAPPAVAADNGFTTVDPRRATAYVPRAFQRRIAVELEVELTRLADPTAASAISRPERLLVPGQYVYHDINVDVPRGWFIGFEVTTETPLGGLRLVPVAYKAGAYWLVRVER